MSLPPAERRCRKLAKHFGLVFHRDSLTALVAVDGGWRTRWGGCSIHLPDGQMTLILDADTPEALEDRLLEWVQRYT